MPEDGRDKVSVDASTLSKLRPILDVVRQINKGPDLRDDHPPHPRPRHREQRRPARRVITFPSDGYKVEMARQQSGVKLRQDERGISLTVLMTVERRSSASSARKPCRSRGSSWSTASRSCSLRSVLCVPILLHEKLIGAVYLDDPSHVVRVRHPRDRDRARS